MKRYLALFLALVMCFSLAACSGGGESITDDPSAPGGSGGEKEGSEQSYNTFISAEPSTLDISRRMDSYSSSIMIDTMEGLVRLCQTGEGENAEYEMRAGEAESWDSNEDGTVWTFHLRDGLKWQDGEPVTADQYVYSLQRSADPDTGCPNSFFLEPLLNYPAIAAGEMDVSELGVKAIDEKTLEITLSAPKPTFIEMLPATVYYPQRQDIIEKYGDQFGSEAEAYIGNGPFKVDSWTHNNSIVLSKNENYWDADSVKLEKVTYSIMTDETTYYNAFSSGQLDMVTVSTKDYVDMFQGQDKNYAPYLSANLAFNFFNIRDELFSNVNIRKAFTLAVDREEFNEVCYDGMRVPTYGWVVPTMTVGETNYRETAGDNIKVMQEELAAEGKTPKDLLLQGMQELGLGDDPSTLDVTFSFGSTNTLTRNIGEYLQQVFKTELGVEIETSFNEWGIFNSNVQSGDYQAGFMAWGAYYNDPYDTLSLLLTGSTAINTGWANEEYDSILNAATAEMDEETRMQEYIKAEQILINEECVVSPMATNQVQRFFQPYVKGYSNLGFTNTGSKYIYIEK